MNPETEIQPPVDSVTIIFFLCRQVGRDILAPGGCETIDAKGLLCLPGGVDPHTHMEFYFMGCRTADDFYTGTKAALAGGTTTISEFYGFIALSINSSFSHFNSIGIGLTTSFSVDFVSKREPGMTLTEAFDDYVARAKDKACCDYGFHVILNEINDQVEDEMEELTTKGVNSFKMFMAYKVGINCYTHTVMSLETILAATMPQFQDLARLGVWWDVVFKHISSRETDSLNSVGN